MANPLSTFGTKPSFASLALNDSAMAGPSCAGASLSARAAASGRAREGPGGARLAPSCRRLAVVFAAMVVRTLRSPKKFARAYTLPGDRRE